MLVEEFLGCPRYKPTNSTDSRNGYAHKKVASESEGVEIKVPMDRNSGFEEKWAGKYPHVIKSLRANWERLMTYF